MEIGSYIGEDGRTYRWEKMGKMAGWRHESLCAADPQEEQPEPWWCDSAVFPGNEERASEALLDARDAPIESEREKWVEIGDSGMRVSLDGARLQFYCSSAGGDVWFEYGDDPGSHNYVQAFRAGLKTGQEQQAEKVRKLVEAIQLLPEIAAISDRPCSHIGGARCVYTLPLVYPEEVKHLKSLARALEVK